MREARVKTVHLIVHGQKKVLEHVKEKLFAKGFQGSGLQPANPKRCGNKGDFAAMIWPPSAPKEITVSEITGTRASESQNVGIGAWTSIR